MKRFLLIIIAIILSSQLALAQQATFNSQGVLREASGRAVEDGEYQLTFKIYNCESCTDTPNPLWTESHPAVDVKNGVFSVDLGTVNPFNIGFDETYWLGVTVGNDSEMQPRTRLTSAPYALSLWGADNKFPSSGTVEMGRDDASSGLLKVYGASSGNEGGEIEIFPTGAYDDAVDVFKIDTYQDEFRIFSTGPDPAHTFMRFFGDSKNVELSDKVGIGTSSPNSKLHVHGAENDGATAALTISSGTQQMIVDGNEIDANDDLFLQNNSTGDLKLVNGGGNLEVGGSKPIVIKRFANLYGGAASHDTGFPHTTWSAAIAGFKTWDGDIDEEGTTNPIFCYLEKGTTNWLIYVDFASHNNHEYWRVDVMFIKNQMVSLQGF